MPCYRVIAHYDHPQVVRSTVVSAGTPQRAMVRALLEGHIPAGFKRDAHGWLVEEFWRPEMGGDLRWPRLDRRWRLVWGEPDRPRILRFEVEAVELSPAAGEA